MFADFKLNQKFLFYIFIFTAVSANAQTWKKVLLGSGGASTITLSDPPSTWLRSASAPFNIVVTYSGTTNPLTISLDPTFITLTPGGVSCTIAVTGTTGLTRTITVSACSGNAASQQLVIAPGSASSTGGDSTVGATSVAFKVDNTAPAGWAPTTNTQIASTSGNVTVTYSAPTDNLSGIASLNAVTTTGGFITAITPQNVALTASGQSISYSISTSGSCSISNTVSLNATDGAGNVSSVVRTLFNYNWCD